jgi:hypothetical protein
MHRRARHLCTLLLALLPIVLSGCAAFATVPPTPAKYLDVSLVREPQPCERYYVLVFSSQNELKQPRFTHTWVTAVRVVERGPGKPPQLEQATISWMPATLEIHPLHLRVEPGINLGLHQTITNVALPNREQMAMWGPYECRPSFYARLVIQKQFMESGRMGYQCIDDLGEAASAGNGCNCVHAITDMDPEHGRQEYPLSRYGFAAGKEITRRLRQLDVLLQPEQTHDFLLPLLGLNAYPIARANPDAIFFLNRPPVVSSR